MKIYKEYTSLPKKPLYFMTVKKWHKVIFHGTWMSPSPQRHSSCSQAQLRSICSAQGCETASGHLPESGKKRGFKTPPEI